MDLADIEGDARDLLGMAGLDPDDVHTPREIAIGLTKQPPIIIPLVGLEGRVSDAGKGPVVLVSAKLAPERLRWRIGHELGHIYYRRIGHEEGDLEGRCDLIGAILVAPRQLVREARRLHGDRPKAIARELGVTQSVALLRLGEIGAVDGAALATRRRVVARGDIVWPDGEQLRRVLRTGVPGGRIVRITDEVGRTGVLVDGAEG